SARRAAGSLRADRRLRAQGVLHGEDPRGHGRRPDAGRPHVVRAGAEERRRAPAQVVMIRRSALPLLLVLAGGLLSGPATAARRGRRSPPGGSSPTGCPCSPPTPPPCRSWPCACSCGRGRSTIRRITPDSRT